MRAGIELCVEYTSRWRHLIYDKINLALFDRGNGASAVVVSGSIVINEMELNPSRVGQIG